MRTFADLIPVRGRSPLLPFSVLIGLGQIPMFYLNPLDTGYFSAAVSHGLSILGTKRKFGGHILKLRFLI